MASRTSERGSLRTRQYCGLGGGSLRFAVTMETYRGVSRLVEDVHQARLFGFAGQLTQARGER